MRWYILGCSCFMITNFSVNHFIIQKYKPEPMETLRLRGRNIAFTNSVIYFSFLDPKLNWKQDLTERRKKFYSFMWACRRVMGKTCRINPSIARWMYKTVLLPQILYASVVCWCVVSRMEAKNLR